MQKDVQQRFQLELKNQFEALIRTPDEKDDEKRDWKNFSTAYTEGAEKMF
jgi:hypothetical protein